VIARGASVDGASVDSASVDSVSVDGASVDGAASAQVALARLMVFVCFAGNVAVTNHPMFPPRCSGGYPASVSSDRSS
jgi:hypothetical protein